MLIENIAVFWYTDHQKMAELVSATNRDLSVKSP